MLRSAFAGACAGLVLVAPVVLWFGRIAPQEVTASALVLVGVTGPEADDLSRSVARARSAEVAAALAARFPEAEEVAESLDAARTDDPGVIAVRVRRRSSGEARAMADAAADIVVDVERARRLARIEGEREVWRTALDQGLVEVEGLEALAAAEADAASVAADVAVVRYAERPGARVPSRAQLLVLVFVVSIAGAAAGVVRWRHRATEPV